MDESTLLRIGDEASSGLYSVSGYIERLPTEANSRLLARYRAAFGRWAPPMSSLSESVFEALHIWWFAARRVGADDPRRIAEEMRGVFEFPRGTVTLDATGRAGQQIYVAEAAGTTLKLAQ